MAQDKPPGRISGWVKAALTSIGGLISGAALMYLTPLVNNVIKPGRPVANFAHQVSGLSVTINNRTTGATQGWWDFGDGSALEPFDPTSDAVTHSYPRPGTYNVKLSVENLLGEESERTVAVSLDANSPGLMPTIEAFEVVPLRPDAVAPATYRIISKVANADLVVWGFGDEPLKPAVMHEPDKYVTLKQPGEHTLRLVAFHGKQAVEKSQTVVVNAGDPAKPMATLQVFYEGAEVKRKQAVQTLPLRWDAKHQGATCPVSEDFEVERGWKVQEARLAKQSRDELRKVDIRVSADRTRVIVSGELVKPKNWLVAKSMTAPQVPVRVELTLERRSAPMNRPGDVVSFAVNLPGTTMLPLPPPPPGMEVTGKRIALELREGKRAIWNGPGLPSAVQVPVNNRLVRVTATDLGNQLRIDMLEMR